MFSQHADNFQVLLGDNYGWYFNNGYPAPSGSDIVDVQETHYYSYFNTQYLTGDIAVVITTKPFVSPPLPFNGDPSRPVIDLQSATPTTVRIVGYGETNASNQNSAGVKYQAQTSLTWADQLQYPHEIGVGNNATATCEGDSGGPALLTQNGTEYIVGTTSYGFTNNCLGVGYDTMLDSYYYSNFLQQYLEQYPSTTTTTPDMAQPSSTDMAHPGSTDMAQPASTDMAHAPGTIGASCQVDNDCSSKHCAVVGTTMFCTASCDPTIDGVCPQDMVCGSLDNQDYCLPAKSGSAKGCSVGSSGSLADFWPCLALCVMLTVWRRRRPAALQTAPSRRFHTK